MNIKIILIFTALLVVFLVTTVSLFYFSEKKSVGEINSFIQCAENGFPVQESYPRRCATPDGRTFTEVISEPVTLPGTDNNDDLETPDTGGPTHELITVATPIAGATVTSPLTVSGQARGYWFFEASFPVELRDAQGTLLATGIAQAQGEWMTELFVPFTSTFTFKNPAVQQGTLVFKKDNPSGLPEHDDEFVIPVTIGVSN